MNQPVITLLTDFGNSDHYVAAMKGVMLEICPSARLIDITHEIEAFSILDGAFTLSQAWRYFPCGSVHLVVVDPGVGTARRPMLAEADGHVFIAPDNGVLTFIERSAASFRARHITSERFFRKPVSRTFHGRDIFAPAAAHIAAGRATAEFGPEMPDPVLLPLAEPAESDPGVWSGAALHIDRFGNAVTNFAWESFQWVAQERFVLAGPTVEIAAFRSDYESAEAGRVFLIPGSSGFLEISMKQGSAAAVLNLTSGSKLELRRGNGRRQSA